MKMNNTELAAYIEFLHAKANDAMHKAAKAHLLIDIDDLVNNRTTEETIHADKLHKSAIVAKDEVRHAEGWLEQRAILRGVKHAKQSAPKRQIIGDLLREQLGA